MDSLLEPIADTEEHPFCTEMMKRLDIQRKNEHFCDVILEVGSGDDQARLKAHRIVLCAASPFFFNTLNVDMKEKKEGVIRLVETSKAVMEGVLDYLYTGHVEVTEGNAYELFAQADYLLIPSLKALSGKFILQTLDVSNCIMAYYFAMKYQWEELLKGARDFILANFVAVAGSEDFLNLSSKQIEEWISSDEIIVKEEEEVFEVIVKWMEKNSGKEDQDFLQLFRRVRCIYVSRNYVFNVILQHPFVTGSTACTKFLLDSMKEVSDGTDECFFSQSPRDCLKTHEYAIVACGKGVTFCYIPSEEKGYQLADMLSTRDPYYSMSSLHSKLFIIGGCRDQNGNIADCYEPSRNLWAPVKAPEAVSNCSAAVTLQGFLYVVGGKDKYQNCISTVQKYNPKTNRWQEVSPLSGPKSSVCAVSDGTYLYAIGGSNTTCEFLDIVERFDPRNNTWDKLPSTLTKRAAASGIVIREKLFLFGGLDPNSTAGDPCEMYDPATNIWTNIPCVGVPRCHASAVSFKGKIYVFGKFQSDHIRQQISLRVYDMDNKKWKSCLRFKVEEDECYQISTLQILRDVLDKCKVLSKCKS